MKKIKLQEGCRAAHNNNNNNNNNSCKRKRIKIRITKMAGETTTKAAGEKAASFGKVHVPYGEDGSGHYTLATKGCFDVIENAKELCLEALNKAEKPSSATTQEQALCIADYGTADGGTSMPLITELIRAHRKRDPNGDVLVTYEDQPNNDFKSLFFYVQGIKDLGRDGYSKSYLEEFDNVYVTACGTSFHKQCFPSNSVHLGVSFTAMHWLNKKPCNITTGVHMTQAKGEERDKFAAQAAEDWENLLFHRANELAPGGRMVIVNFCVDANGYHLGYTDKSSVCMYDEFNRHWQAMMSEGKITKEEYEAGTILNYYRNDAEMRAPFAEGTRVFAAGLRLVSAETKITRCPYNEDYVANKANRDAREAAKGIIGTMRTWSNSSFLTALDSNTRTEAERKALVDELYGRYEDAIAADPEKNHMDYAHHYIVMEKVGQ